MLIPKQDPLVTSTVPDFLTVIPPSRQIFRQASNHSLVSRVFEQRIAELFGVPAQHRCNRMREADQQHLRNTYTLFRGLQRCHGEHMFVPYSIRPSDCEAVGRADFAFHVLQIPWKQNALVQPMQIRTFSSISDSPTTSVGTVAPRGGGGGVVQDGKAR